MSNKLVAIPHSELPKLRDVYRKDWPKHYIGYHTIDNYFKWLNQDPSNRNFLVYSLNGDWSDGSYLILDNFHLFINTCSDDHSKISKLLSLVDWSKEWDIFGYVSKIRRDIENFIDLNNLKIWRHTETYWTYLSKEEAIKYDVRVPEGFKLKQLNENDAEIANLFWLYHKDGTNNFMKRLIRYNPSVGIFNETTQELAGWIMRSQIGALATLHVKDEYKRRGFGSILVKALSKMLAEMGEDACTAIVTRNVPSMKLFDKLGFKIIDKIYWAENTTNIS